MTGLIDIHSHLYPPAYLDLLRSRTRYPRVATVDGEDRFIIFPEEDDPHRPAGRPISEEFWSLESKLAFMDRTGIDQTVLSLGNPWLDPFDGSDSPDHAAAMNKELAGIETRTGGRVVSLGVLPSSTPEAAARCVHDVAANGRLRGVVTGTRVCGLSLDAEPLEPVWAALHQTRLPWLLHPSDGLGLDAMEGFGTALPIGLAFPFETTVAVTRLVLAGVLERFPGIRLVASHGGGTLPFLAARLDAAWRSDPAARERLHVEPSVSLARIHVDAVTYHARALEATSDLVQGKLAFGTDHPFSVADPQANLDAIATAAPGRIPPAEQVCAGHARGLFSL